MTGALLGKVNGMEVVFTLGLVNKEGTPKMSLVECDCNMNDITITLVGRASWFSKFFSIFGDAFEGQIKSTMELTIIKRIKDGIPKLDSLLQTVLKEISVDDISFLNVTYVNEPLLGNSSVGLEINGSFISTYECVGPKYYHESKQASVSRNDLSKLLEISIEEHVLNSGSNVYFITGDRLMTPKPMLNHLHKLMSPLLHVYPGWTTAAERCMNCYCGAKSSRCMDARASSYAVILRNNLIGRVSLDDFTQTLK
ncbi:hypothetical protein GIB67_031813 [Kingdonia uniflora]|uniref:Uncharacterized protein n=1 Tax=Kingdonia uniflora TaxID=39325 RepID=A0A7J7L4P8_9MAGN|nr:hypothetical protein GIB67_031813 [Kingdonia uniflora]